MLPRHRLATLTLALVLAVAVIPAGSGLVALPVLAQDGGEITFVPFTDEESGFSGLEPEAWTRLMPGTSVSPDGQAFLLQASIPGLTLETVTAVVLPQLGFTEVPEMVAEREANGLTWSLFMSEVDWDLLAENMPPVIDADSFEAAGSVAFDAAVAEGAGQSFLVGLITLPAGRDALYETLFLPVVDALLPLPVGESLPEGAQISEFGRYAGYSEPLYDDYVVTSEYVEVRDGTRLAVDGAPVKEPLPVILTHTRYHRANVMGEDARVSSLEYMGASFVRYGYVLAAVDVRGSGASFGVRRTEFTPEEANDSYDITEWLAAQPWCDGYVGMFGRSYLGITQYKAAGTAPPHLRAIFPEMASFDLYATPYHNGIYMVDFLQQWDRLIRGLDDSTLAQVAPVDDDPDGELLAAAIAEHAENGYPYGLTVDAPYRDSDPLYLENSPSAYVDEVNGSGVAIYHLGGWFDMCTTDPLQWYVNLDGPQRIAMPGWNHQGGGEWLFVEQLRWFDYWLKGIDNGIMDEPPVWYEVMGAPPGEGWRPAEEWPLPDEERTRFYFRAGPSGSVASVNDGLLSTDAPADAEGQDDYVVDYTLTVGLANRYTSGYGGGFNYPNLTARDERALTYTTPPLEADVEVTGHPVVSLWVTSTADDGDFFVYLEEVDADGFAHYITEGKIRASHRALHEPPFDNMGLPWHRSYAEDVEPLPAGEPVQLLFDMRPTSNLFDQGHRIRVTVTGADADNFLTPELDPAPTVSIYRHGEHASYVELPIIP